MDHEGVAPVGPGDASPSGEHERARTRVVPHRAVLAALFLVYVLTRYPDVGGRINMGDSAKFQFLARTLGVGHAPGNPLYLVLSALWVRIPLPLDDATKVTLLSGVFGLLTLVLVTRAVGVLGVPPVLRRPFVLETRTFAALLLGLGSLFWTFATEAEVYTLGTVFVAGTVLGTVRWTKQRDRRGLALALACVVFGLSNHLTIAALGPGLLFVLLRDRAGREALRSPRLWGVGVGALALTALAYGWIAWRLSDAPLVYSEFPKTFDAKTFFAFITARGVAEGTFAKTTYAAALFDRLPDLFAHLQKQWSWPLLLCLPFGATRLVRLDRPFAIFLALGVLGHLALAFVFRIPDPEGLFVSVAVLLVVPLALVPASVETDLSSAGSGRALQAVVAMILVHGALVAAHVNRWLSHLYTAYVQQTPEGLVVLNLPTLADVAPKGARIGVPCGHYGCVEVVSYYRFVDPALREKDVGFVRFPWSEWDESISSVPLVSDPRAAARARPLCVLLRHDVTELTELGLELEAIPRRPVRVHGRTFISPPLHCVR